MNQNNNFIAFLEIVINQIVYLRKVYPSQIFKKQQGFGLSVFINLFPPLNDYIKNVLTEAMSLLSTNQLRKIEIRILSGCLNLESYFLEVNEFDSANSEDLEVELKNCIVCLEKRCKILPILPKDSKFKVFLHTNFYDFKDDSRTEDCLWIKDHQKPLHGAVVPILMNSDMNCIQFYVSSEKNPIEKTSFSN